MTPTATTTVVGVMGDPIAHSLSPLLHNAAFSALGLDWVSVAFRVPAGSAGAALAGVRALGIRGLSVTMPHKSQTARLVDRCSPVARRLGAVNCVVRDGALLVGHNTDGEGFLAALRRGAGFDPAARRCLVLGAGGAARAVVLALAEAGAAEVAVWARRQAQAQAAAGLAGERGRVATPEEVGPMATSMELIVQATPVGMHGTPAEDAELPVPGDRLMQGQIAVDLIYDPYPTRWLSEAAAAGATTLGGLGMLVHQAAGQLERWIGVEAPLEAMWAAAREATTPGAHEGGASAPSAPDTHAPTRAGGGKPASWRGTSGR